MWVLGHCNNNEDAVLLRFEGMKRLSSGKMRLFISLSVVHLSGGFEGVITYLQLIQKPWAACRP